MSNNIRWRFPSNGYAATSGLDTADLETFKSDVNAALAREIVQNSIDAKNPDVDKPVRVEFKSFKISREEIPGYNELVENIHHCIDYWKEFGSDKTVNSLQEMLNELNKDKITCLRISDYNTTGLTGISKMENSPWHNLIHGTGVSEKNSTSGGSKGIGKFATFVNSHFRTVFYFTRTKNNEMGYEGVCKLCSGNIPGTDEKTQGIGYYSLNDKNQPILNQFSLDKNYRRKDNEFGTDIFILGFKNEEYWKEEIICKVLDSFISAINFETLEVNVDNICINKANLEEIVYDNKIVRTKQQKQKILSQYLLLNDPKVLKQDIEVENLGLVTLYVRLFDKNESDIATNKCTMIRYPYMKIKDQPIQSLVKISALCIIPNNRLNAELRKIENPQHIDWEYNRIENVQLRNSFRNKISGLYKTINEIINNYTLQQSEKMTALEGSEEFIAQVEEKEEDNQTIMKKTENTNVTTLYRPNPTKEVENKKDKVNTEEPEFGDKEPYDPEKNPQKPKAPTPPTPPPAIHRTELKNLNFKFMCVDKSINKYLVSFESNVTEDDAEVVIVAQDEGNYAIPIQIYDCIVNEYPSIVEDNSTIHMKLKKGNKYTIVFKTVESEMFACWIKAYAYKK